MTSEDRPSPGEDEGENVDHLELQYLEARRAEQLSNIVDRVKRDRAIEWVIFVVIAALLGWLFVVQYQSANQLRQTLYRSCLDGNQTKATVRKSYQELATLFPTGSAQEKALHKAASDASPTDCSAKYLNDSGN